MHLPETAFRAELRVLFPRIVEGIVGVRKVQWVVWVVWKVHLMMGRSYRATRETQSRDALSATNVASVILHTTATRVPPSLWQIEQSKHQCIPSQAHNADSRQ